MIMIVDSGLGNGRAVRNMAQRAGFEAGLTTVPESIAEATCVILPGVGAFDAGMRRLRESGFADALKRHHDLGRPILGICLGMQLLSEGSEEGFETGLGFIDAQFLRMDPKVAKVPHVGWNRINPTRASDLFPDDGDEQRFYFVHSYAADLGADAAPLATCHYGIDFCCAYQQGATFGVQFHPEKSHKFGLSLLRRFLTING